MNRNPILDLPLHSVMRPEIALPLAHMMHLYTVEQFLRGWRHPPTQRGIEQIFDTPEQARHAAQVCAAWLGTRTQAIPGEVTQWWANDGPTPGLEVPDAIDPAGDTAGVGEAGSPPVR